MSFSLFHQIVDMKELLTDTELLLLIEEFNKEIDKRYHACLQEIYSPLPTPRTPMDIYSDLDDTTIFVRTVEEHNRLKEQLDIELEAIMHT